MPARTQNKHYFSQMTNHTFSLIYHFFFLKKRWQSNTTTSFHHGLRDMPWIIVVRYCCCSLLLLWTSRFCIQSLYLSVRLLLSTNKQRKGKKNKSNVVKSVVCRTVYSGPINSKENVNFLFLNLSLLLWCSINLHMKYCEILIADEMRRALCVPYNVHYYFNTMQ